MTPIQHQSIQARLLKLRDAIIQLETIKKYTRDEFLNDALIQGAASFYLILGIELVLDIGQHILVEEFQRSPKSYRECLSFLGELQVIPESFATAQLSMAGFRNRVIHNYTSIDVGRVFDYLQQASDVFRQFATHFSNFLDSRISS